MYMIITIDVRSFFGMKSLAIAIEIGDAPPSASPARKQRENAEEDAAQNERAFDAPPVADEAEAERPQR
jgi:hypothetical protein